MWSHYGDQHRGLCLGHSVPDDNAHDVHEIEYGGSRFVQAKDVDLMLSGDQEARQRVDEAVLLRKARPWAYEREWRLLGPRGEQNSPLELEEVVFGLRCSSAVRFTIIQALARRERPVRFYEIREQHGRFPLVKRIVDTDELMAERPHRNHRRHEILRAFEGVDIPGD